MKIETDPSGISIRLIAERWDAGPESAAVAEIVRRGKDASMAERITRPIGVNAPPQHVDLTPGDYTVRIFLPSGDVLAESVTVGAGAKSDDGNLAFDLMRSPHDWLSLNAAVGAVQRLPNDDRVRNLESWRSAVSVEPNLAVNLPGRVNQAITDFNEGNASLKRAAGVPTGEAYYSTIDRNRAMPEGKLSSAGVVEWWMGQPVGAPVPLVITHHDDRNAKLGLPANDGSPDLLDGSRRLFARIRDPRGRLHHAVYPAGWARISGSQVGSIADVEILMTIVIDSVMRGEQEGEEAAQWRCAPAVLDVEAMAYLGFLHSGNASAAEAMLERAYELLYEKRVNPVAAAAGAFGLLAFPPSARSRQRNWRNWVRNLYSWFPNLPDAAIAMAQLYLRQGEGESSEDDLDIEKLRGFALEATRRGVPYLTFGIRLLSEILMLVTSDDQQHERSGALVEDTKNARRMVRELERRVVPSAFFTVLETAEGTT